MVFQILLRIGQHALVSVWTLLGTTSYGYWLVPAAGAFIGWARTKTRWSWKALVNASIDALAAVILVFVIVFCLEFRKAWVELNNPPTISFLPAPPLPPATSKSDDAGPVSLKPHTQLVIPRAHLHVSKFEWTVPDNEDGRASVKVIFVNDGSAPTTKVVSVLGMAYFTPLGDLIAQREFESRLLSKEPVETKEKLESSDNQIPVGVDRSFTAESSPWTQNAIRMFLRGNAVVYVAGSISYSDARARHKTSFCGFVGKDGNMKFCGKNNQED